MSPSVGALAIFSKAPFLFTNTPTIFQDAVITHVLGGSSRKGIFGRLNNGVLQWIDDTLLYSTSFEGFYDTYKTLLRNCIKWKVRLNIDKCTLVDNKIIWCGRLITRQGWRYQDKYFNKILKIKSPTTMGEIEDVLYTVVWLSLSIPNLSKFKEPIAELILSMKKKADEATSKERC